MTTPAFLEPLEPAPGPDVPEAPEGAPRAATEPAARTAVPTLASVLTPRVRERLDVRRGVAFGRAWRLLNRTDGTLIPLTGYTARLTIRRYSDDEDAVPLPDTAAIVDPATSRVIASIPAAVSADWRWQRAVYDLDLVPAAGPTFTLRTGEIVVSTEIGR